MESLEEKAKKYSQKNYSYSYQLDSSNDFKAGYKECISDLKEFIRVNPKATSNVCKR